jgi:hypothetical protein
LRDGGLTGGADALIDLAIIVDIAQLVGRNPPMARVSMRERDQITPDRPARTARNAHRYAEA